MGKVIVYIAQSLDGYIAAENDGLDWLPHPTEGEDYGLNQIMEQAEALVMGYRTFQICDAFEGPWPYPNHTSYVFSRSEKQNTAIDGVIHLNSDPVAFIKDLKQRAAKDIWLMGGGNLIAQIQNAGLIDEYQIAIVPTVLGKGIPLFPSNTNKFKIKITNTKAYPDGLVMITGTPENNLSVPN